VNTPVNVDFYDSLANTPKMGARIRDDFGQPGEIPEEPATTEVVETAMVVPLAGSGVCPAEVARDVEWRAAAPGSVVSTGCPPATTGTALRQCGHRGWARPQLGQCRAVWLASLTGGYRNGGSVGHLSALLRQKIATEELYGGDIISLLELIESSVRNFQFHTTSEETGGINKQVLRNYLEVLSGLLEQRVLPAWLDLAPIELEFQRTRFIGLLQELGVVGLETNQRDTTLLSANFGEELFKFVLTNFISGFSVISLLREDVEGVQSGSDFSTIALGATHFLRSLTRNSPRLVLLEVSKVDTLLSISDKGQFGQILATERGVKILTQVVSVFAKTVKNRFMSEGINITMKHLAIQKGVLKVSCQ
jgi:hypothetical protein